MLKMSLCSGAAATAAAAAVMMLLPSPAWGLINPTFTPVELVRDCEAVLQLEIGPVGAKGEVPVAVTKALKGKAPAGRVVLDLSRTDAAHAKALREMVGARRHLALLFVGAAGGGLAGEGDEGGQSGGGRPGDAPAPADAGPPAILNVQGLWFRLLPRAAATWDVQGTDEKLLGVWSGGTDMLLRGIEYLLSDPHAAFPVAAGAAWAAHAKVATVPGDVSAALAVDLAGEGRLSLLICSSRGDRLLRCQVGKRQFADLSAETKLASRSRCAAWADFDADGRGDLASFDGKTLTIWRQTAAGQFEAAPAGVDLPDCIALAALDVGQPGRAGLLVSTAAAPLLLTPKPGGGFSAAAAAPAAAPAGQSGAADPGQAYACLLADLDADGLPDILPPMASGSLFYKGAKLGAFAAPVPIDGLAAGPARASAFLGDYDADGLLDVFVAGRKACGLWRNLGGAKFAAAMPFAGEVGYISKPNAVGGGTCDFNNDGRQDLFLLYSDLAPQFFFSRGFACFGHARDIGVSESGLLPQAEEGQQAGVVADLDGDAAQDLAIVLTNGEVWVFFRDAREGTPTLAARVALAAASPSAGPVLVTASAAKRPLGAWCLAPGQHALVGLSRPGPCVIEWRLPGQAVQRKQVVVTSSPKFVTIP